MCAQLSLVVSWYNNARGVTARTFLKRFYLVLGLHTIAPWVNCSYASTTLIIHWTTISRFFVPQFLNFEIYEFEVSRLRPYPFLFFFTKKTWRHSTWKSTRNLDHGWYLAFLDSKRPAADFWSFLANPPKLIGTNLNYFTQLFSLKNLAIRMNDFVFKLCFVSLHRVPYPFYFSKIKSKSAQTVTHSPPRLAALLWYACALCILWYACALCIHILRSTCTSRQRSSPSGCLRTFQVFFVDTWAHIKYPIQCSVCVHAKMNSSSSPK